MIITKAKEAFKGPYSSNDDQLWKPIAVEYTQPEELLDSQAFETGEAYSEMRYYDQYFKLGRIKYPREYRDPGKSNRRICPGF